MTDEYKIRPDVIAAAVAAMVERHGDKALPVACEQTMKIVSRAKSGYGRFGLYWPAMKAALRDQGYDVGGYHVAWLATEYSGASPLETLVAGWEFSDGREADPQAAWEIDGTVWDITDPDY